MPFMIQVITQDCIVKSIIIDYKNGVYHDLFSLGHRISDSGGNISIKVMEIKTILLYNNHA